MVVFSIAIVLGILSFVLLMICMLADVDGMIPIISAAVLVLCFTFCAIFYCADSKMSTCETSTISATVVRAEIISTGRYGQQMEYILTYVTDDSGGGGGTIKVDDVTHFAKISVGDKIVVEIQSRFHPLFKTMETYYSLVGE